MCSSLTGLAFVLGAASVTLSRTGQDGAPKVAHRHVLERVAVVGASLSDGFNAGTDLATVLDVAIEREHEPPGDHSDSMLFLSPRSKAEQLLGEALEEDPSLIVAIDLPFWFGYGNVDFSGGLLSGAEARLQTLELFLKWLERIETPIVLGDFPDMSPAVGGMLSASQMPERETLERLNERIHAWAANRPHVVLIPLARMVEEIRADDGFTAGSRTWAPGTAAAELIQPDRLHPTEAGLEVTLHVIKTKLVERGWAVARDFAPDAGEAVDPGDGPSGRFR